ncbi:MAG TPA: DUF1501 domain-containing protein [Planctomycetota bacterium]|nr:DUF1501 domain-containing protein [Planctomycetota bacterium]
MTPAPLPDRSPITRRQCLLRCANGFGMLALQGLLADQVRAATRAGGDPRPRYRPRARSVIFLYMDGGPSQVDTFDPKPLLTREHGRPFGARMEPTQFDNNGNTLGSPWAFHQHGDSGLWVSELFPHVARNADRLCVVRSMVSEFSEHTNANYFLHTGSGLQGRPSMGAWIGYGLGSEARDLPAYVVLNGGLIPPGGVDNFHSGFLPAHTQGSIFRMQGQAVANLGTAATPDAATARQRTLLRQLDAEALQQQDGADAIAAAIANYELAFAMQAAVPELLDLGSEGTLLQHLYGIDHDYEHTRTFARQCLLARRLVERGVRFVQLTCPDTGHDRWDQHGNLKRGHDDNCRMVDQPIGALLQDLQARGLLDDTLVVWAGEFGRTPFAQGKNGRDHNPFGFSIWLAGGGVRGGMTYGATDDYGYKAVQDKVTIHDLHATILHLLGLDHQRLTYRFGGRDLRLTDVYGEVVRGILA